MPKGQTMLVALCNEQPPLPNPSQTFAAGWRLVLFQPGEKPFREYNLHQFVGETRWPEYEEMVLTAMCVRDSALVVALSMVTTGSAGWPESGIDIRLVPQGQTLEFESAEYWSEEMGKPRESTCPLFHRS